MKLETELKHLLDEGVIDSTTHSRILSYYASQKDTSGNRQILVFGILGALLAGLGIILIVAHNWDHLPKSAKLFFSFLPLIIGQAFAAYTMLKKPESRAWREGASVFLTFAVGAAISLVSQIYQIQGSLAGYMLSWSVLIIPLVYIMKSSITNMLFMIGAAVFAINAGSEFSKYHFLWLFALALPHYLTLWKNTPRSNFLTFHHWVLTGVLCSVLPVFINDPEELIPLGYIFLFGSLYLLGNRIDRTGRPLFANPFLLIGSLGTVVVLLLSSFRFFWGDFISIGIDRFELSLPDLLATIILFLGVLFLYFREEVSKGKFSLRSSVFLIYGIIWLISFWSDVVPTVLSNALLLILSIRIIKRGLNDDHLGILNYGLLILTALVACRFFDSDMDFILRGILFLLLGLSFFYFNYRLIRSRSQNTISHE